MIRAYQYLLGIDLGASSLGWAALGVDSQDGSPRSILAAGVRIFEAGVEGDIEQGKDASRAVVRREARQPRRQQWRRQHRKSKLFALLQQSGLLPPSDGADSAARKDCLDQLDIELTAKVLPARAKDAASSHDAYQKLPYILRDRAATDTVDAFELGRALYHLAQRRGYQSNRKGKKDDDEEGKVAAGIGSLQSELDKHGDLLGSYFSKRHNPFSERIRRRYTAREMYRKEFDAIRAKQSPNFPQLSDADWDKIDNAIFFQRPLKSQKHLIGRCELELDKRGRGRRRCALALPIAQEFRILQKVNDLRIIFPDGRSEPLSQPQRDALLGALREQGEMSWGKVRTLLNKLPTKLPKSSKFNLEEWGDKLIGHRTNAKMIAAFGRRWLELSDNQRESIALEVLHYRKPEALQRRAMKAWGLDEESAKLLAQTHLEEDYASHSKRALQTLISGDSQHPGMSSGASYATARKALYPQVFSAGKPLSQLPPVSKWKDDVRNPAVIRALTELRKVVNLLVLKYGKPARIHIELAREIRNPRKKRKEIWKQNEENRKRREKAARQIVEQCKVGNPRKSDVEKWLLAEECNWECPYCGTSINAHGLIGDGAEFNVEHIYPRRYLDDSYLNKTIACRKCNDQKGDRSPAAAYSDSTLDVILQRVERFQGTARDIKLARFKLATPEADFTERQLNDTRYNSRLAAEYLGLLYGGITDESGQKKILTPTGQLTGRVRACWQLNDLLGDHDQEKERDDHRHHAIDAIVIATLNQGLIQRVADAASAAGKYHSRHFFERITSPWTTFKHDVGQAIRAINVSHRPTRTIAGPLHGGTIYSKNFGTEKKPEHRIRKPLASLKAADITGEKIAEPSVARVVRAKWEELGKADPAKLWAIGTPIERFPKLAGNNTKGSSGYVFKVRIRAAEKPTTVGRDMASRNVGSVGNTNYASMVYAVLDAQGAIKKWDHMVVTRMQAHQSCSANRAIDGERVLCPVEIPNWHFLFALRKNDMVLADGSEGQSLYRVQSLSADEIMLCPHHVAQIRDKKDKETGQVIKMRDQWTRVTSIDNLRKRKARPVEVNPLGEIAELSSG